MEKSILLASFIHRKDLRKNLDALKRSSKVFNDKVFILRDSSDDNKLVLTYNILVEDDEKIDFNAIIKGTVSLHRKKETNTLYTLNALNEVVLSENNNKLDKNFTIDWDRHRNCILLYSKNKGLIKIKTIIESIKHLNN